MSGYLEICCLSVKPLLMKSNLSLSKPFRDTHVRRTSGVIKHMTKQIGPVGLLWQWTGKARDEDATDMFARLCTGAYNFFQKDSSVHITSGVFSLALAMPQSSSCAHQRPENWIHYKLPLFQFSASCITQNSLFVSCACLKACTQAVTQPTFDSVHNLWSNLEHLSTLMTETENKKTNPNPIKEPCRVYSTFTGMLTQWQKRLSTI